MLSSDGMQQLQLQCLGRSLLDVCRKPLTLEQETRLTDIVSSLIDNATFGLELTHKQLLSTLTKVLEEQHLQHNPLMLQKVLHVTFDFY